MPPTRGSAGLPVPLAPWHDWHFTTYTDSPCFTEPVPAGNPAPLGGMLISHAAISCVLASRPSPGPADRVGATPLVAHDTSRGSAPIVAQILKVDIDDAPIGLHPPGLDHVVVVALPGRVLCEPG